MLYTDNILITLGHHDGCRWPGLPVISARPSAITTMIQIWARYHSRQHCHWITAINILMHWLDKIANILLTIFSTTFPKVNFCSVVHISLTFVHEGPISQQLFSPLASKRQLTIPLINGKSLIITWCHYYIFPFFHWILLYEIYSVMNHSGWWWLLCRYGWWV